MPSRFAKEKQFAIAAVRRACKLTSSVLEQLVKGEVLTKDDKSPVTAVDFAAQALINTMIRHAFPNDAIIAEEDATSIRNKSSKILRDRIVKMANEALIDGLKSGDDPAWGIGPGEVRTTDELLDAIDSGNHPGGPTGRIWTVDPIDGTMWYMRKGPYAVILALVENAQVQVGVMGCPNLPVEPLNQDGPRGCIFVAVRGQGVEQLTLSGLKTADLSIPSFAPSKLNFIESADGASPFNDQVASILGITNAHTIMDSMAVYCSLARGDGGAYLRMPNPTSKENIWDHSSGALLVEEAGGKITDSRGHPLNFGLGRTLGANFGVVACGKEVHAVVLKAVSQAQAIERDEPE